MPSFRWKGRSAAGHELTAVTSAPSANDVIGSLREKGIAVISITQVGGDEATATPETVGAARPAPRVTTAEMLARARTRAKPRPFRGMLIASAFFLAAFGVGYFAPIVVCTCEHVAGGRVDCTLAERDLGLVPLRAQSLAGVTKVEVESKTSLNRGSDSRTHYVDYSRIVLGNAAGATIRPTVWDQTAEVVRTNSGRSGGAQWVGVSTDTMQNEITSFLMNSPQERVSLWQGQTVLLTMAGVLAAIGVLTLGLTVLGMFARSTDWVYAVTGRMAVWAEERRRQQSR